jgi:glycogen synthase
MPLVVFYFQLHQPFRLHPDGEKFLWEEKNRDLFIKASEKSYLPSIQMFTGLIQENPSFKITLGLSGTFLEQAEQYRPDVVGALQKLMDAGVKHSQVEMLDETYYHSLTSLFKDSKKKEFRAQILLHREMIKRIFGIFPTAFHNTELIYNRGIANVAADMGYKAILRELRKETNPSKAENPPANAVLRTANSTMIVLTRNRELSDDIAFRFSQRPLTPDQYAKSLSETREDVVLLGYDMEHIGGDIGKDLGIFAFWKGLPEAMKPYEGIAAATPTEIAERFLDMECPVDDAAEDATSSLAGFTCETFGWLTNSTQYELFRDIEKLEKDAIRVGGSLFKRWRQLTASDHLYFLHETTGEEHAVQTYLNPYGDSIDRPAHILTRKIDKFEVGAKRFNVIKKKEKTAVLILSPETGRLPEDMGGLARFISGKSGGQGEVVSALCEGLIERGIEVHLALLNLKKRFQREMQMSEGQWREARYSIDPENIHLISSPLFADNFSAYSGDPIATAAEFQNEIIKNVIKTVRAQSKNRLIIHTHDWMAGGAVVAYAKATGLPVLHTVHNVFTALVPLEMLSGIDIDRIQDLLSLCENDKKPCVDAQATAIKNATMINFVGERFLQEVVEDYFMDRSIVPPAVRSEVKQKYRYGFARAILNAPSSFMYPERCDKLERKYGPNDDVLAAKRENRISFQKRVGLNVAPDATLFYWPSRLDPVQKGVELIEQIVQAFVQMHANVQFAFVADGVGNDRTHADILGGIAWSSGGRISYSPFSEDLSLLGYAAASDVFGASLYEPCGQIDQVGNLFGATATNRDTGGYHDKIRELRMKEDGRFLDAGNGFLFNDYDVGGLWYGLEKSLTFHRKPEEMKEKHIRRIMREARERYSLDHMIAEYIAIYEKLNAGRPLA